MREMAALSIFLTIQETTKVETFANLNEITISGSLVESNGREPMERSSLSYCTIARLTSKEGKVFKAGDEPCSMRGQYAGVCCYWAVH